MVFPREVRIEDVTEMSAERDNIFFDADVYERVKVLRVVTMEMPKLAMPRRAAAKERGSPMR